MANISTKPVINQSYGTGNVSNAPVNYWDEFIEDPKNPAQYTTVGEQNGYNPADYVSEMELMQQMFRAQSDVLPDEIKEYQANLGLSTNLAEMQQRLLPSQEKLQLMSNEYQKWALGMQKVIDQIDVSLAKAGGDLQLGQIQLERDLLPLQGDVAKAGLGLEREQIGAQREILPGQTEAAKAESSYTTGRYGVESGLLGAEFGARKAGYGLEQARAEAETGLIGDQTDLARLQIQDKSKLIRERSPVISKFYEEALSGVDPDKRAAQAQAGVEHAYAQERGAITRNLQRYGLDPSSGAGQTAFGQFGISKATSKAAAGTTARTQAEQENFERKRAALGIGL